MLRVNTSSQLNRALTTDLGGEHRDHTYQQMALSHNQGHATKRE